MPDAALLTREQLRQRHLREASHRSQRRAARRLRQRRWIFALWQVILPVLGLILLASVLIAGLYGKATSLVWIDAAMTALGLPD